MAGFDPAQFDSDVLRSNGIEVAFGVPDSSLSGLLSYFSAAKPFTQHIVTASEGAAVALAAGYYLATRKVALVYVQNSGLSNALNPLQSIAAKEVFGIPMLLLVGWRGKPGEKDEPQHALIGPRLLDNLRANDFPFEEVPNNLADAKSVVARLVKTAVEKSTPVALVLPRKTFKEYIQLDYHVNGDGAFNSDVELISPVLLNGNAGDAHGPAKADLVPRPQTALRYFTAATRWLSPMQQSQFPLSREEVMRHTLDFVVAEDTTVSSLGGNSREVYMILKEKRKDLGQNFFCIGGMGHSYALAQGIGIGFAAHKRRIWCLDGDGSFIMHLGNNAVLAGLPYHNGVIHVVVYNGVYSSTGNQPIMISPNQFLNLAEGLPYQQKIFVDTVSGLRSALSVASGGTLIVALTNDSASDSLPRPKETSTELRDLFVQHVEKLSLS